MPTFLFGAHLDEVDELFLICFGVTLKLHTRDLKLLLLASNLTLFAFFIALLTKGFLLFLVKIDLGVPNVF